jgi:hypothetical protein
VAVQLDDFERACPVDRDDNPITHHAIAENSQE